MLIAQLSDVHVGGTRYRVELLRTAIEEVNADKPDLVVVAGDLTDDGYPDQYPLAARELGALTCPRIVRVPVVRDDVTDFDRPPSPRSTGQPSGSTPSYSAPPGSAIPFVDSVGVGSNSASGRSRRPAGWEFPAACQSVVVPAGRRHDGPHVRVVVQIDSNRRTQNGHIRNNTRDVSRRITSRPNSPICGKKHVARDRACTRVTPRNLHGKEGSTVRVRQRALQKRRKMGLFGKRSPPPCPAR